MKNQLLFGAIATSALSMGAMTLAPEAQALLIAANPVCTNGGALTAMNPDALDCSGAWAGNDANQQTDVLAQLTTDFADFVGNGEWSFTDKADAGQNTDYFDSVPGTPTGTITFDNPLKGFFAIALKSSNNFSLYLFDGGTTGISSLDFTNIGTSLNPQGNIQDLSHASLYSFDPEDDDVVPTPAAVLPILGGLFGAASRRKKGDNTEV